MDAAYAAVLATAVVSAISLVGVITIGIKKHWVEAIAFLLLSFSTGSLMGGAFFHLIPEALRENDSIEVFKIVLLGFIIFYLLERVLRWHHCHEEHCDTHKLLGYQNLFGDGIHNFIDGLIIASAFAVEAKLGMAVTVSVALHEIPQEISDYGVLIYSGFSKYKALLYNAIAAFLAIVGAVVGSLLISQTHSLVNFLLPLAAGGFIYISASDLVPELHREKSLKKSFLSFVFFLAAIGMMLFLGE